MTNRQDTNRPSTGERQATDRRAVDVATAARHFGISADAVRGRLHRGTLDGERRRGQWVIFLDVDAEPDSQPTGDRQDTTGHRQDADRLLIEALQAQVEDLQRRLDRADVHLQAVIAKLPNPETAPIALDAHTASPATPGREEAPAMTPDALHARSHVWDFVWRLRRRSGA